MEQILVTGLAQGLVLSVLAAAFQLVYLPTRVFFVAMAAVVSAGPYVFEAFRQGVPAGLAVPAAVLACGALAWLIEVLNHRPLVARHASDGAHLVSSIAIYILVVEAIAIWRGGHTRTLLASADPVVIAFGGGGGVTYAQAAAAAWSIVALAVLAVLLFRTSAGLKLRALAANPVEFALRGQDVHAYRSLAFFLSGVLAGLAGILFALGSGFEPHTGLQWTLLAVVAAILGGPVLLLGPLVGGLVLGLTRAQVTWSFAASLQDAAAFALLALVLVFRPRGLLARDQRVDAITS